MTPHERRQQYWRIEDHVRGRFASAAELMARRPPLAEALGRVLVGVYADRLEVDAVLRELRAVEVAS